tara:strand:- start:91 stop:921 length:831 start_codon:yes stop_codon:yes gene_type:complete
MSSDDKIIKKYIRDIILEKAPATRGSVGKKEWRTTPTYERGTGVSSLFLTKAQQDFLSLPGKYIKQARTPGKIKGFIKKIPSSDLKYVMWKNQDKVLTDVEDDVYENNMIHQARQDIADETNASIDAGEQGRSFKYGKKGWLGSREELPYVELDRIDIYRAAQKDLDALYSIVKGMQRKSPTKSLEDIGNLLRANWRPSFKEAYDYLQSIIDEGDKANSQEASIAIHREFRLLFLKEIKKWKEWIIKAYPGPILDEHGKGMGTLKTLYDRYIKLFS